MKKNSPYCPLNIENHRGGAIFLDENMRGFLGIYRDLDRNSRYCVISLKSPTYFIHCDTG